MALNLLPVSINPCIPCTPYYALGLNRIMQGSCQSLDVVVGTPAFMGPELHTSNAFNGQLADAWALGATIYMLLCGHPPFVASQLMELYEKVQHPCSKRAHTHFGREFVLTKRFFLYTYFQIRSKRTPCCFPLELQYLQV